MHIEWLIEQIDAYCAQNAELAAAEDLNYKEEYQACLEFLIDEMKGRLG
jgi:hypothetical protein